MFANCSIKLINDHIVIDNQKMLIDTGSPISFHPSGVLCIGENRFDVPKSIPGVTQQYLSDKVGCDIDGILGMDVINMAPTLISLKDRIMFFDDDAVYHNQFKMYPLSKLAGGLFAITIAVNSQIANMIVDTGAPISYILPNFLNGLNPKMRKEDFSPLIGNFDTETYLCEVECIEALSPSRNYEQLFGIPPHAIAMTLNYLKVDGIIGIDLFKQYRMQLRNGILYFPPQGI